MPACLPVTPLPHNWIPLDGTVGAAEEIRTPNLLGLSQTPLPIGLQRHGLQRRATDAWDSNICCPPHVSRVVALQQHIRFGGPRADRPHLPAVLPNGIVFKTHGLTCDSKLFGNPGNLACLAALQSALDIQTSLHRHWHSPFEMMIPIYWGGRRELNSQPPRWRRGALPIELLPHQNYRLLENGGDGWI